MVHKKKAFDIALKKKKEEEEKGRGIRTTSKERKAKLRRERDERLIQGRKDRETRKTAPTTVGPQFNIDKEGKPTERKPIEFIAGKGVEVGEEGEFRIGFDEEERDPARERAERVLGVTLAVGAGVLGGAAAFFGGAAALKALAFPVTKAATHIPTGTPTITVSGKAFEIAKIAGTKTTPAFFRVGNNVKNFALKKSILQKLASTAKNPRVIFGLLASGFYTSLFWAPNEKGDALTTLTISQNIALRNGDFESVFEIDDLIQETLDISASVPVTGFLKSEYAKYRAAAKSSETSTKEALKLKEESERLLEQGETDFARERREGDEAAFERKKAEEKRVDERFEKIRKESEVRAEEKKELSIEEEERQDKRFRDIETRRKETKLAEEETETAKFDKIEKDRIARQEEDDRIAVIMQEVWRLRREGKFSEADELELTVIG